MCLKIFYVVPRFCFDTCYVGDAGLLGSSPHYRNAGLDIVTSGRFTFYAFIISLACYTLHPFHHTFRYTDDIWWTGKKTELRWRFLEAFIHSVTQFSLVEIPYVLTIIFLTKSLKRRNMKSGNLYGFLKHPCRQKEPCVPDGEFIQNRRLKVP